MTGTVTQLLQEWGDGDPSALDRLMPLVYGEMRRLARRAMRKERGDHTLNPTALVHEAFLSLAGQTRTEWKNRSQFYALTALMMRRVTIHHAARIQAAKRGGGNLVKVPLEESRVPSHASSPDLLALNEALSELETLDSRQAAVVELRFFGGLTVEEIAQHIGVSAATIQREWRSARAWLASRLTPASRPYKPPQATEAIRN